MRSPTRPPSSCILPNAARIVKTRSHPLRVCPAASVHLWLARWLARPSFLLSRHPISRYSPDRSDDPAESCACGGLSPKPSDEDAQISDGPTGRGSLTVANGSLIASPSARAPCIGTLANGIGRDQSWHISCRRQCRALIRLSSGPSARPACMHFRTGHPRSWIGALLNRVKCPSLGPASLFSDQQPTKWTPLSRRGNP